MAEGEVGILCFPEGGDGDACREALEREREHEDPKADPLTAKDRRERRSFEGRGTTNSEESEAIATSETNSDEGSRTPGSGRADETLAKESSEESETTTEESTNSRGKGSKTTARESTEEAEATTGVTTNSGDKLPWRFLAQDITFSGFLPPL